MGSEGTKGRGLSSRAVLLLAVAVVAALFGYLAVQFGHFPPEEEPRALCRGLGTQVDSLDVINGANGFTKSGPAWIAALGWSGLRSDVASQERIAVAVAADVDGYQRMVAELAPDDRAALDHLRTAALEPDGLTHDPAHPDTVLALRRLTDLSASCGIAG